VGRHVSRSSGEGSLQQLVGAGSGCAWLRKEESCGAKWRVANYWLDGMVSVLEVATRPVERVVWWMVGGGWRWCAVLEGRAGVLVDEGCQLTDLFGVFELSLWYIRSYDGTRKHGTFGPMMGRVKCGASGPILHQAPLATGNTRLTSSRGDGVQCASAALQSQSPPHTHTLC
jgi:hypothetical protein